MARLTDGKRTVDITMAIWQDGQYAPDWSNDFYDVGLLAYDEDRDVYIVENIDYCIEAAMDWKNAVGDYAEDYDVDTDAREVWVNEMNEKGEYIQ